MAFAEICRQAGVPPAIERSRSGNGVHAWFFFSAAVPARAARAMGCHLLTETLARRHQLGLDSYDRLFPSQDTLPRGGFGNLIALPLQQEWKRLRITKHDHHPVNDAMGNVEAFARMLAGERVKPAKERPCSHCRSPDQHEGD